MVAWHRFCDDAPTVAAVFLRRHRAAGSLCLLATLRSDGHPRISPMEPTIVDGHLVLVGMPGTVKFRDLARDPRFSLHTATVDPYVGDGDAKLWGTVGNVLDAGLHERFAAHLVEHGGPDVRGQVIDPFFVADIAGGSCLTVAGGQLTLTVWKPDQGEHARRLA